MFDNPKTVVLERIADAIRLNPLLLDFAACYRFEPRPVAPYRGNEKGRVERAIRYLRHSFYLGRRFRDLEDLNAQARDWCLGEAMDRPWPEDSRRTVRAAFEEEKSKLLALPEAPFPTEERCEVKVGKTPYLRFDGNDYSVPSALVRKTLVVSASTELVRVIHDGKEVARHSRSYDHRAQIEDPKHIEGLVAWKREARQHRGLNRLAQAVPSTQKLLENLAEQGKSLGNATARLLTLLDTYGAQSLESAVREVLERQVPHVHAVRQVLEREHAAHGRPPAIPPAIPTDPKGRGQHVQLQSLEAYDALVSRPTDKEQDHGKD